VDFCVYICGIAVYSTQQVARALSRGLRLRGLFQNRCLALASLIFASLFAANAAPLRTKDAGLNPPPDLSAPSLPVLPNFEAPVVTLTVVDPSVANLPDDPSAPAEQGGQPVQPDDPQSFGSSSAQPAQDTSKPASLSSEEQLKQEEHQRVFGVMAAFNTTVNRDAPPLTSGQKFQLFFRSQTDPWPFALTAVVAGFGQATDDHEEYGQGFQGYAKRYGAAYGDAFIGNFFGNAVLTSLWHEDPRYFQKGTGSFTNRALWAATSTVWCKRDNGSWGPNYANLIGNLIGSAIANVYYPASERTATDTVTRSLTVSAEGIVGSEVIEFWPDIVRHYEKNHAAKLARKAAQQDAQAAAQSVSRATAPVTAPPSAAANQADPPKP